MKPQLADPARISSPGSSSGSDVCLRGVSHSYGELRQLWPRSTCEVDAGGVVGLVGPSGCGKSTLLELICGLREPSGGTIVVGGCAAAAGSPRPLRLHAPARPPPPLVLGDRQRRPGAAQPGDAARAGASSGPRSLRALRPRRLRGLATGRALRRDAAAGRLPTHPDRRQAGPGAGRALRRPRRDHPRRDAGAGWRRRCAPTPAPSSLSPTTSRRRSTSATGWRCFRHAQAGSSPS